VLTLRLPLCVVWRKVQAGPLLEAGLHSSFVSANEMAGRTGLANTDLGVVLPLGNNRDKPINGHNGL
jgi:hypothetical protein